MPQHRNISDPNIHEPKGVTSASAGVTYVADGNGSGSWSPIGPDGIDMAALEARLENDILNGDFNPNAMILLTGSFRDISSETQLIFPVPLSATVLRVQFTLGGPITTANNTLNVLASTGGSMGPATVITFSGSAKGDTYTMTPTGNNILPAGSWFEVVNNAASSGVARLGVGVVLRVNNV